MILHNSDSNSDSDSKSDSNYELESESEPESDSNSDSDDNSNSDSGDTSGYFDVKNFYLKQFYYDKDLILPGLYKINPHYSINDPRNSSFIKELYKDIPEELFNINIDNLVNKSTNIMVVDNLQYLSIIKLINVHPHITKYRLNIHSQNMLIKYLSLDHSDYSKPLLLHNILKDINVREICSEYNILHLSPLFYTVIIRYLVKAIYNNFAPKIKELACRSCGCYFLKTEGSYINSDLRRIIPIGTRIKGMNMLYPIYSYCWDCHENMSTCLK